MQRNNEFHQKLKSVMDEFANKVYDYTETFPKKEIFGLTSQLRRAALSVILNYLEGYARQNKNVLRNFLEISYGSLKESKYLIYFSYKRKYLEKLEYQKLMDLTETIGAMLWGVIEKIKK
ncbi:MAG TPA: four helix bundle protein [Candidatus Paceibacterota bacterium]|nr:four helix bundle protein [Candidatus Paceibacterota bacterium]